MMFKGCSVLSTAQTWWLALLHEVVLFIYFQKTQ